MPYRGGKRLPGERASKLGHLDVIHSELVNNLVNEFEHPKGPDGSPPVSWTAFDETEKPLRIVFAVDGSMQPVRSDTPPYRELAFVKTALVRLDQVEMGKVDKDAPHPLALRDLLAESVLYHATVLPLRRVSIPGLNNYDAVRRIIFESLQDQSLRAEPYVTLKWLSYEKWTGRPCSSPNFQCPHCDKEIPGLPFDADEGKCPHCGGHVYLSDMLGFHLEMAEESAPQSVATAYMLIHETLLLFTGIRHFWEREKKDVLHECLFIKDGPLTLRSQYSKLVIPIRRFFEYAKKKGIDIHVIGQEKTGIFADHLEEISRTAIARSFFLPSNQYIREQVQHAPEREESYGSRTNYGNKLFVSADSYHHMVLSVPTGDYKDSEQIDDLIGIRRILSTLPTIISHRYEGALLPIQLANGVASLSTYPSAEVLKIFADL
jgi:hypothetical protein